ncbi:MAG: acyltransferase family protein [Pseudomonadales bacterium]|nr:acyltransferase family protein [Pseudomonadales bacterium]
MKSTNFGYIPALDHLRGFAALLVLYFHGSHFITHKIIYGTPYDPANWFLANNPLSALVIEGHTAVSLFFVLSGFVFTVGSLHKNLNYFGFFRNRFLRTYPLFLFFLFLGIVFNPENFDVIGLLQSIFFLANSETALNGGAFSFVFWSIAVEWHFYLVFPFLLLAVQRKGWQMLPLLIAVFLLIRVVAYYQGADMRDISYWSILGRIDQFLIGMLAGIYYRNFFRESKQFDLVAITGTVVVLASLFTFNQFGGGGLNNSVWIYWTTLEGAAWAFFVLGYLSIARHYPQFVNKGLVGLGTVSYSIYLVHYVVLDFFMQRDLDTLITLENALGTAVINVFVIMMPLVVAISAVTYYCIERPFLVRRTTYVKQEAAA